MEGGVVSIPQPLGRVGGKEMAILPDHHIKKLVKSGKLVINPFDEKLVHPASYDLCLGGKILASPLGPDELGATIELNEKKSSYWIQTGQMVGVISAEWMELPLDLCGGDFGIRSEYARRGIVAFGGVQLDPGWRGRLTLNLQNVGPEPVKITLNDPIFTVVFYRLEEPAEEGYSGNYQDQDDFPQEQYDYILSAHTTSLAEIPTLRQEMAKLNVLLEELEERLPDPDEGLELNPEFERSLHEACQKPHVSPITPDEAWERFNL